MKKIHTLLFITLGLLLTCYSETHGQTVAAVQKHIEQANKKFIKWFNNIQPDSIVLLYHPDACITGRGCGKTFIQTYYKTETGKYTFRESTTLSVTVKDDIATENGQWKIMLSNNVELSGKYITEWKRVNKQWLIFKETVLE